MMTTELVRTLMSGLCLILFTLPLAAEPQDDAAEFSQAETLLWMTDQLRSIERPVEISYRFDRSGTIESGFTDTVRFIIDEVKDDGMKSASLKFFTGERTFDVAPVESTNVNPVLKIYLQGDVYEMNRLTDKDGKSRERWRYFQRRIKFALAESATIADIVVPFDGKDYAAQKVSFSPYVNDPKRQLFEEFADKTYSIIVCDELPGYLYSIETIVPGDSSDALPRIKEVLQLVSVDETASGAKAGL